MYTMVRSSTRALEMHSPVGDCMHASESLVVVYSAACLLGFAPNIKLVVEVDVGGINGIC